MIERRIAGRLKPVAARFRRLQFAVTLASGWLLVALLGTMLWWLRGRYGWQIPGMTPGLLFLGFVALVVAGIRSFRMAGDYRAIAQYVESYFPDLDARLLTAMQQEPKGGFLGGYTYLQEAVIRQALQHEHRHKWRKVIPTRRMLGAHLACLFSFVYLAAVLTALMQTPQETLARSNQDWQVVPAGTRFDVRVEPGNTELERGSSLLVTARFTELLPPEVELVVLNASGEEQRLPMKKSLDDPLFGVRVPDIQEPVRYRIEFVGQGSDEYQVTLFEYPRLLRADARLHYPSYTKMESREIQDVRRLTAVEGTQLTIACQLNKPVAKAILVGRDQPSIELEADPRDEHRYRVTWTLAESGRYRLHLVDHDGREGRPPMAEFSIRVSPNREPDLKWTSPARDLRVSPLEEVALAGTVRDDFGIIRYGISYRVAGHSPREVVLGDDLAAAVTEEFQYLLDLESLDAAPDQLVSYHLWADDHGSDGEPRRSYSDMFFAEVRHFEEIFRQGQSPEGQQAGQQPDGEQGGGGAQQAEELAELQKQIMNGTWKLIRRETGTTPSPEFASDLALLNESQQSALEQLDELEGSLQDPQSLGYLDETRGFMREAVEQLHRSLSFSAESLTAALESEQAAYQSLLQLRAREHEVVRSSQNSSSSSSSGGSSPSQQQLQQLELRDSENRYETERLASDTEDPAQREVRQALNRLRELARRQGDLNERVKELQSALEQAADEEERRELERQLKRLREEQQEILRDTEELQQRMEREEMQERMADSPQQLAETRENVRQASEALEQGQLSQAITSGTRAEREFQDLQEELRQQASSQFEDTMREMRDQGRRLSDQQSDLMDRLEEMVQEEAQALRSSTMRETVQQGLEQQQQELADLLEQMKDTIQNAEEAEPLLSQRLYDSFRRALQDDPREGLDQAAKWLRQGIAEEAESPLREADQGIRRLAQGIDRAAEGVLGDEAEALRRAGRELERLADELDQELRREANPPEDEQTRDEESPTQGERGEQRPGQRESEQPGSRPSSRGEPSDGESEPGDGSATEGQPAGKATDETDEDVPGRGERDGSEEPSDSPSPSSPRGSSGSPSGEESSGSDGPAGPAGETEQRGGPGQRGGPQRRGDSSQLGGSSRGGGGGLEGLLEALQEPAGAAPLTGEQFLEWSDRLRDVEEMIGDPELRAEAARIRDRARGVRMDLKRHSRTPNWDLVQDDILRPLVELRDRVIEEARRRRGEQDLVPIDRDPVPIEFQEQVRRYYERLGSGR